ncbi:late competence development ComFB family protein [Natronospira bacteriovora]|uniref:Late competence development ComFB family protein n=1 Tax=Natronospira bacteriovora TaxID=3069753 RepID=A0ABU0W8B5_9GAMM|nr:late competence development ComFB family protein [Natronospira sp. AB-CW4]MDQ2069240.1 late competence development ComFB family protein [Natronospira sp. AB-CW4]
MFEISNFYEQLVQDYLWKRMESRMERPAHGFVEDVACVALNQLPPRYVRNTVDLGSHLSEEEFARMEDAVEKAVDVAIERVTSRPRNRD